MVRPDSAGSGPAAVYQWVILLDQVTGLLAEYDPEDPHYQRQVVAPAIATLYRCEHLLDGASRRQVRETIWRRDRPREPLPQEATRREWAQCRCSHCRYLRLVGASQPRSA
jgi:hypothetical protein